MARRVRWWLLSLVTRLAGTYLYTYDAGSRLTNYAGPGWGSAYTYDNAGNRLTGDGKSFAYDERNRLTSGGGTSYTWSARGNRTGVVGQAAFTFDALDRQTGVGGATYTYDSLDRVIGRSSAGVTKFFNYAGFETDPVADGTSSWSRSPGGSILGQTRAGVSTLVGTERHGDVAWTLNPSTGTIADSTVSDPFGKPLSVTGTPGQIGYQGDYADPVTGLVWMAARWYDTQTGTFTSRDTYAGEIGAAATLNRYSYALGNPLRYWDPTGHMSGDLTADVSAAFSMILAAAGAYLSGNDDYGDQVSSQLATFFTTSPAAVTPSPSWTNAADLFDPPSQSCSGPTNCVKAPDPVDPGCALTIRCTSPKEATAVADSLVMGAFQQGLGARLDMMYGGPTRFASPVATALAAGTDLRSPAAAGWAVGMLSVDLIAHTSCRCDTRWVTTANTVAVRKDVVWLTILSGLIPVEAGPCAVGKIGKQDASGVVTSLGCGLDAFQGFMQGLNYSNHPETKLSMESLRSGSPKPFVPLGKVNLGLAIVSGGLGAKNQWDQDRFNPDISSNQRFVRTVIQGVVPTSAGFGGAMLGAATFSGACAAAVVTVEFAPACGLVGALFGSIGGSLAGDKIASALNSNLGDDRFKPISAAKTIGKLKSPPGVTSGAK